MGHHLQASQDGQIHFIVAASSLPLKVINAVSRKKIAKLKLRAFNSISILNRFLNIAEWFFRGGLGFKIKKPFCSFFCSYYILPSISSPDGASYPFLLPLQEFCGPILGTSLPTEYLL